MDNQVNPFIDKTIPLLKARDVELRVGSLDREGKWVTLLAYKDARVDMRILDEVYGPCNWQRKHTIIDGQLFCTVSIWDDSKQQWIEKQDVGTESKTEAEKGRASDSFKRACFNLGIGRELYDAPFIYINLGKDDVKNYNGKVNLKTKFHVKSMQYNKELGEFDEFVVVDDKGKCRFAVGKKAKDVEVKQEEPEQIKAMKEVLGAVEVPLDANTKYVRMYDGKWQVFSKKANKWAWLSSIKDKEKLIKLQSDDDYKVVHKVIFDMLLELNTLNG